MSTTEDISQYKIGGSLRGTGMAMRTADRWLFSDVKPVIGESDKSAAVEYTGVGGVIENITLWSAPWNSQRVPCPIGIHVYKPRKSDGSHVQGLGTGQLVVRDAVIEGFDAGIQFGQKTEDHNADTTMLENIWFRNCQNAILFKNSQAMGFTMRHLTFAGCETAIKVEAGGGIWLDGSTVLNGVKHVMLIDGLARWVSRNNGFYCLRNVKLDNHAAGCTIFKQAQPCLIHVLLDGVHASQGGYVSKNPFTWLDLSQGATVKVSNSWGLTPKSIRWNTEGGRDYDTQVTLDNCRLGGTKDVTDLLDLENSQGKIRFVATNCTDDSGKAVDDFTGYVSKGEPIKSETKMLIEKIDRLIETLRSV